MLHFADALVNHLYRNRAELTSWMVLTEPSKEFIFEVLVTCFIIGRASIFEIGGKGISNFMGFCKAIHCYRSFSFTFKLAFPCFPEGSGIFRQKIIMQIIRNVFMLCCLFVSNSKLIFSLCTSFGFIDRSMTRPTNSLPHIMGCYRLVLEFSEFIIPVMFIVSTVYSKYSNVYSKYMYFVT